MPSLFITRQLSPDSPLKAWCTSCEIELVDQSLLHFQSIPFGRLPKEMDWIFFYSPRAVEFFFMASPVLPPKIGLAAIGHATAKQIAKEGFTPHFVGNGNPGRTAAAFGSSARGKRILFPRAQQSLRSIERLLGDRIEAFDIVVYDNQLAPKSFAEPFDTLIFTSPLNVKAFLQQNTIATSSRVIALGPTTANALKTLGYSCEQAESPSETDLVQLLKG